MAWRAYVVDTISGQLLCPIDLPNFSWSVSVADSSLSTTKSKGVGQDEVSGLKVPWTAVPANSPGERDSSHPTGAASHCAGPARSTRRTR